MSRRFSVRWLLENVGWLLASLAMAVFVWVAAVNQQNPVEQQRFPDRIPVQVLKDENLLVVEQPAPVQVVVRAPRSVWDVLDASDISVVADLRGKPAGTYTIPLEPSLAPSRLGMVSEVQPAQTTINLVNRSEKVFDINVVPVVEPPVGFQVVGTELSDSKARVSGSESAVSQVAQVVARVSLANQTKPVTRTIPVLAVDADGRTVPDVVVQPQQVQANINVQPRPGVTVLQVVPDFENNTLPAGYVLNSYSADPVTVAVRGDRSAIEAMNGQVHTDPISLANKTSPFSQTVKLALPTGVTLTDPVNVSVSVEIEPITVTREFDNIPVQTQGLDPADFQITVQPQTVSVIVKGPQQAVNTLQANEITVIAPLAGLGSGSYTVTLEASVAHSGLTASNLSIPNSKAQVTIVALHPTLTPTASQVPPTATPTSTATATATP